MTQVVGEVFDIGFDGPDGTLWLTSGFRAAPDGVVAPVRRKWEFRDGTLPDTVEVEPGPAVMEIDVGVAARGLWEVVIPDDVESVTLRDLIHSGTDWSPWELTEFQELTRRAERAAVESETQADRSEREADRSRDEASRAGEEADRSVREADRSRDEAVRSETARDTAREHRDDANTHRQDAQTAQAASETARDRAEEYRDAAGTFRTEAREARDAANEHRINTVTARNEARQARDTSEQHADRSQKYADDFGLTFESETLPEGSEATVTVSGEGPTYSVVIGVPVGDQGVRGPTGEVSQAELDAAVASLVDGAPEALDTLNEFAQALGNDPNFAATVSERIGRRATIEQVQEWLDEKADEDHRHQIADVDGLQDAIDNATTDWGSIPGRPSVFPPSDHNHHADDINAGVLAIDRIPTGTTSATVAAGDDPRLSDPRDPNYHEHVITDVAGLRDELDAAASSGAGVEVMTRDEFDQITPDPDTVYLVTDGG